MANAEFHWGATNVGPDKLFVWLEPWAEEFEVPARSTITLRFAYEESEPAELEVTADRVVVWVNAGQTAYVFIDNVLQESASASLPVPGSFCNSTKDFLNIIFGQQPSARLGGKSFEPPSQPPSRQRTEG